MITKNPIYNKMLKDFISHIERRGHGSGWMIIDKGLYRDNSSFCRRDVKRGGEIILNLYAKWKSMSDNDLDYEVDSFLKTWDDKR
mgnify:CR=1 FL=1|jgi:hypothetical protein